MKNKKVKLVFISLLLFNTYSLTSQVLRGEILYKQEIVKNIIDSTTIQKNDAKYDGKLNFINRSLKKHSDEIEFILKFNRNESIYKMVEKLQNDNDNSYKIAIALSRGNDINYINIQSKERLVQKKAYGKLFIVKSDLNNINWKLSKKTKTIENYKCYLASTTKIVKNSKGIFEKPVIAWYAPEISLNYGPKGYGNLPGLILELQEGEFKYYAAKITLNPKKKININIPSKGELLTEKEFEARGEKLSSSFWEGK